MSEQADWSRYRDNFQSEADAAAIYAALAAAEREPALAEVFRRMSESEQRHAAFWAEQLRNAGVEPGPQRPSWRARCLIWAARRFGSQFILPTLADTERSASGGYGGQPEVAGTAMPGEERSHARMLTTIARTRGAGVAGGTLARLEGRHRAVGGNALRAAVLGANDGLCSALSLVMGVAGANLSSHAILITGVAGMLACASSMAMGEWLSVQSSRELYQRQIAIEQDELNESPEEERTELALIYQAKGLSKEAAESLATGLMADPRQALDTLAREELGIDPEELGGSAWEAAGTSFVLCAVGAIFPVGPFIFLTGAAAVAASVVISAVALFLLGAAITLLTGRGVLYSGIRQLIVGLGAAGVTFGVGRLIGHAIG